MEVCKGRLFDIHHLSTHDGPGLRSTIFLKGCSLACKWCHNPEGISYDKEIQKTTDKGTKVIGEDRSVEDVYKEIVRHKLFYINSGGGVTFSGGEALTQGEFVYELAKKLKANEPEINIAMDTCLEVSKQIISRVFPYVDLWLVDLKLIDTEEHKNGTGSGNEKILENFEFLISELSKHKEKLNHSKNPLLDNEDKGNELADGLEKKCWIRTPLIPEYTMTESNIKGIGEYISRISEKYKSKPIKRWELCTYNNLCEDKYNKLDKLWTCKKLKMLAQVEKEKYEQTARLACPYIEVKASGLVIDQD